MTSTSRLPYGLLYEDGPTKVVQSGEYRGEKLRNRFNMAPDTSVTLEDFEYLDAPQTWCPKDGGEVFSMGWVGNLHWGRCRACGQDVIIEEQK